ncbi:MAG: hypothetical protein ACK59Y_10205 [Betaproteobacteria bacterium]|jgi:hypothetical protein|nr:hypothetical protein [Betaproteobacteria bacterium]
MNATLELPMHTRSSVETLSFRMFIEELRAVTRDITDTLAGNPLEAAVKAVCRNPALIQARLLTRILAAYVGRSASFRRAEVAAFDHQHLVLLAALMQSSDQGLISPADWTLAADTADAAQRAFDA